MAQQNPGDDEDQQDGKPDNRDGVTRAFDRLSEGFGKLLKANKAAPKTAGAADASAFFRAVKANDAAAVEKILDAGFDPDTYNGSGQTALHVAALANAQAAARLLIERGANPLLGRQDEPTHTPLEDAVNFNKPEMAELLARHGGYVPGAKVNGWSLLHRASEKGKARIVEALLNAGADCNETTENGSTPLLIAIKLGQTEVVRALLRFPAVLETLNDHFVRTDAKKRTAFQLAVDHSPVEVVAAMIAKGANVNRPDAEGRTPLMAAIERGKPELVRLLIEAGADLNKVTAQGTPLAFACATDAIGEGVRAETVALLIRLGADPDIPTIAGMQPIHLAMTKLRSREVLAELLRYPVDKNAGSPCGTPLMIAAATTDKDYLRQLLDAGADPNVRDPDNACTPLIYAVIQDNAEGLRLLLQAGANPRLYDAFGKSALSYAREKKRGEIVGILEQALKDSAPRRVPGKFPGF